MPKTVTAVKLQLAVLCRREAVEELRVRASHLSLRRLLHTAVSSMRSASQLEARVRHSQPLLRLYALYLTQLRLCQQLRHMVMFSSVLLVLLRLSSLALRLPLKQISFLRFKPRSKACYLRRLQRSREHAPRSRFAFDLAKALFGSLFVHKRCSLVLANVLLLLLLKERRLRLHLLRQHSPPAAAQALAAAQVQLRCQRLPLQQRLASRAHMRVLRPRRLL